VEVEDGRSLCISWQRGDDPVDVARSFAKQHGIKDDELAEIMKFVQHAENMTSTNVSESSNAAPEEKENAAEKEPETLEPDCTHKEISSQKSTQSSNVAPKDAAEEKPKALPIETKVEELPKTMEKNMYKMCARPGCKFQVTWHTTHCCHACKDGKGHGGRCERKKAPQEIKKPATPVAEPDVKELPTTESVEADTKTVTLENARRSFPVMLEDGRQLLLEWQQQSDIAAVARCFAMKHGLGEEQLPQIVGFMQQIEESMGFVVKADEQAPVPTKEQDIFEEQISQIKAMGFMGIKDEDLRTLLEAMGGDLQQVVETLMAHLQQ